MLTRLGPPLAILLLAGPIVAGLAGTVLPALGYFPALGGFSFSLAPFAAVLAEPGIWMSVAISLGTGLAATAISLGAVMLFVAGWSGTRIFAPHPASRLAAAVGAACGGGLRPGLPDRAVGHAGASRLAGADRLARSRPTCSSCTTRPGSTMTAGLIVKEIPFLLLIALAALPQTDPARTRALAASLGYGQVAGFLHGTWPPLYRQMRLAVFAVIAFSTSVVDVAQILGPTTPAPLAVRLIEWMRDPDLSMRFLASAGALLQLGVTALAHR